MSDFDVEYRIAELIAREATGVISEKEQEELNRWKGVYAHEKLYKKIVSPEEFGKRNQYAASVNVNERWKSVLNKITFEKKRKYLHFPLFRYVAGLLLLVSIAFYYIWQKKEIIPSPQSTAIVAGSSKAILITDEGKQILLQDTPLRQIKVDKAVLVQNDGYEATYCLPDSLQLQEEEMKYNTLVVPRGGEYILQLSDGTRIWLDSDSEIYFPVHFTGNVREVRLKGEAYFEVAHDSLHPFYVDVYGKMKVSVLGTKFNIQAYAGDFLINTTLNEGKVRVSAGQQKIDLAPNQQAIFNPTEQTLLLRQVNASDYSAWKDGMFIFENARLEEILNRLARWYDISVFWQTEDCKDFHFTGDLEKYEDVAVVLKMLEKSTDICFDINGRSIVVRKIFK